MARITSFLRRTDGFSYEVRERSSFKTPVFSNFFLKRFSALSMDSFSFTLTTIIILLYSFKGCKYSFFQRTPQLIGDFRFSIIDFLPKSQISNPNHLSGYNNLLYLRGSLADGAELGVAIEFFYRKILRIAVAAKNLDR